MLKKITFGSTNLSDLYEVFRMSSMDVLENRRARLFPLGQTENETLTTSIFLASLSAVKEYREELFSTIGVNKIKTRNVGIHVFTELESIAKDRRPDGLVVITSGKHNPIIEWAAFVEVKVGKEVINSAQVDKYIEFGRDIGISNIITISNEMVTTPLDSPVKTNKRSIGLFHWSWKYLLVMASKLVNDNKVEDEDHVFILNELQRYLRAHRNIQSYNNMGGKEWKEAVRKIHDYAPTQKIDKTTLDVLTNSLKQEEKDISLELTESSKFYVEVDAKEDRNEEIEKMLLESKVVTSTYIINQDKNIKFKIEIDFIRQCINCCTTQKINTGKAQAQTTNLLKTLDKSGVGASDHILVKAVYKRNKFLNEGISVRQLLNEKEHGDQYSVLDKSLGDEIKEFEIKTKDMLHRDFQNPKNFVTRIEEIAERFVQQVMTAFVS
jgi:hypothetical protein